MKRIEFNKYMDIISYNNDIIIFNKLNSAIVLMDKNRIKNNNGKYFCDITEEEFEDFKENDFFFSSEEVQKYIESIFQQRNLYAQIDGACEVSQGDKILTLSTGSSGNSAHRYLVQGVLEQIFLQ